MDSRHVHEHTKIADLVELLNHVHAQPVFQLTGIGCKPAASVQHILNFAPDATMRSLFHVNTSLVGMMARVYEGGDYPPTVRMTYLQDCAANMERLTWYTALENGGVIEVVCRQQLSHETELLYLGLPDLMLAQLKAIAAFVTQVEEQANIDQYVTRKIAHFWSSVRSINKGKSSYIAQPIPERTFKHVEAQRILKQQLIETSTHA